MNSRSRSDDPTTGSTSISIAPALEFARGDRDSPPFGLFDLAQLLVPPPGPGRRGRDDAPAMNANKRQFRSPVAAGE